jgi:hypothetical protein
MARIVTAIHLDLKFRADLTPPVIRVDFTDQDEATGAETQGHTYITDAAAADIAARLLLDGTKPGLISALKAKAAAKEAEAIEPSAIPARMAELADAEDKIRQRQAAAKTLDEQIAAKQAELAALTGGA